MRPVHFNKLLVCSTLHWLLLLVIFTRVQSARQRLMPTFIMDTDKAILCESIYGLSDRTNDTVPACICLLTISS